MAQKTIVQLIDDLDEGPADETVSFALDGATYEIDLSTDNAAALRDALARYVGHARRVGRSAPRSAPAGQRTPARGDREQTQAIREWARRNGHKVGDKGRIPGHIMEAFNSSV